MTITHSHRGLLGEIIDLLIQLEADHHAAGWDNSPPRVYRASRGKHGQLDIDRVRLGIRGIDARTEFGYMAAAVQQATGSELIESIFDGTPLAHLLVFESWQHASRTVEEHKADRRSLADVPGSFEARCGIAVIGKQTMAVNRIRDEEPVLVDPTSDPNAGVFAYPGGMFASLMEYHQAVAAHWRGRLAIYN